MSYIWEGDNIYYLIIIKSIFFILNILSCILSLFSPIFHTFTPIHYTISLKKSNNNRTPTPLASGEAYLIISFNL